MKLAKLFAAGVIAVALAESALGLYGPHSVATEADWRAAADQVKSQLKPDDLIVFAPAWVDQVGRQYLGDRMPVAMVARADADHYARIWELSIKGGQADEAMGLVAKSEQSYGRVTLRLYEKPAAKPLHDFTAHFADARTTIRPLKSTDEAPCATEGEARRCGTSRIEPRIMEIDYHPRRGILAPAMAGQTITLAYDEVPGGLLVGYVGLHDYYARKNGDGVVTFRVRADDKQSVIVPVRVPSKEGQGWQRFELPLGEGTHQLRFEIEAEHASQRLIGFAAEVRAP